MDFSYEIVMAIYIEEVMIRGQELFSLKIYAAWQRLNVNVQDAESIFKNISSKTRFGVSQLLRWPKIFFNLQNSGALLPIFYGFAVDHAVKI